MNFPQPTMSIVVDPHNPGQYFGCCGLFLLADQRWPDVQAWFTEDDKEFCIAAGGTLNDLMDAVSRAKLIQADPGNPRESPIIIGHPFPDYVIDWWKNDLTDARDLKVWAGSMQSFGIAEALQFSLNSPQFRSSELFHPSIIVTTEQGEKKEPYYFDSRRTTNAHSRDIGFSPNDLSLKTMSNPATELFCLIGLQAARPVSAPRPRLFDYFAWHVPIFSNLLLAASGGWIYPYSSQRYRFESWYRTGQRKHKAFRRANAIPPGDK
jgi:hypothetical protein